MPCNFFVVCGGLIEKLKNISLTVAVALLVLMNASSVFAQESTRGRETQFVTTPAPSVRTEPTVVPPDEVRAATFQTADPTPAPTRRVAVPTPSEITCTKSMRGQCTIFACSDGANTNTCDLACKTETPRSSNIETAESSINTVASGDATKILSVTPSATSGDQIVTVELYTGTNFKGYDSVLVGDKVVSFSAFGKDSAIIKADFRVPSNALAGPTSLTLINQKYPKSALLWSSTFVITPGTDAPTIVSVTPSHGKVGDIIQMKVVKGKKNYDKGGFPGIGTIDVDWVSSTFTKSAGWYTLDFKLTPKNTSGTIKLGTEVAVIYGPYFTVDKPGAIESFLNYMGSFFK